MVAYKCELATSNKLSVLSTKYDISGELSLTQSVLKMTCPCLICHKFSESLSDS